MLGCAIVRQFQWQKPTAPLPDKRDMSYLIRELSLCQ
jgi:hypothetical protein